MNDPVPGIMPQDIGTLCRQEILTHQPCPDAVIYIMVDICDLIGYTNDIPLQCRRLCAGPVVSEAIADLPGQIQTFPVLLQTLCHADALLAM